VTEDYEDSEKRSLKLFVVGELSGDPSRWSRLSKRTLVLARTPEEALEMADFSVICAEVDLSQPAVLSSQDACREFQSLAALLESAGVADSNGEG
jgi:hypothetical protein